LWQQRRRLRAETVGATAYVVLPFRGRYLATPSYWGKLLVVASLGGVARFVDSSGALRSPLQALLPYLFPLQPLISILLVLHIPRYWWTQILRKFVNTPESRQDEFVGFGAGKGAGGLIFWLTIVRKARRYGALGLAHDTYWGMPLGVHSWPVAIWCLAMLGFRRYAYLSVMLLATGLGWVAFETGHLWLILLVPIVVASPYYCFNLYTGTWEILAWGWAVLALAASLASWPAVAGMFVAATLLTHPGVSTLTVCSLVALSLGADKPLSDLIVAGVVSASMSAWFIVPYWRARHFMGRSVAMNSAWNSSARWNLQSAYQFLVYSGFCVSAYFFGDAPGRYALLLLLPLVVLFWNVKVRWVYSQYTTLNFMLVIGAIYLLAFPALVPAFAYLAVIFTAPELIWGSRCEFWGFDLTPVTLGERRRRLRDVFAPARGGRIAFEMTEFGSPAAYDVAALNYILADSPVELFNGGYAEVGDPNLFLGFGRFLNTAASPERFEAVCRGAGIRYVVAFSSPFRDSLRQRGGRSLGCVEEVHLSPFPNAPNSSFELFELPWPVELITPFCELTAEPNRLTFVARAGEQYLLKYSAFGGWLAEQHRMPVPIADAKPGILIRPSVDGLVTLEYRYRHYWRSAPVPSVVSRAKHAEPDY
jgi:hypothetical protein